MSMLNFKNSVTGVKDTNLILTAILFQVEVNNSLNNFSITNIREKFAEFLFL